MLLQFRRAEHVRWAQRLGLTDATLEDCLRARTLEGARAALQALRTTVKQRFRELALELHPDHHPGDAQKENDFKELSDAYQAVEKFLDHVEVKPRPAAPPMWPTASIYTGSASSTGICMPNFHVRIVRVHSQGANATNSTVTNQGSTWFHRNS